MQRPGGRRCESGGGVCQGTTRDFTATTKNAALEGGVREVSRITSNRSTITIVPIAVLALAALATFLRFDGQRGHRARFEALHADLFAGLQAIAIRAVFDTLEGLVDLADELALAITRAQLEAELLFLRGAIVRIREVRRFVFHVRDGAVHFFHEVALPAVQDVPEVVELDRIHVLLAAFGDVRRYVSRACEQAAGIVVITLVWLGSAHAGGDAGLTRHARGGD